MMQRTFIMLKPDAVARNLMGTVITRLEAAGLKLVGMKFTKLNRKLAEENYTIHKGKPFYEKLIAYVTSGPVVLSVWEGEEAVTLVRKLVGATKPLEAAAGTIRGDLGQRVDFNIIHASDSPENAKKEISLFFKPDELVSWERIDQKFI